MSEFHRLAKNRKLSIGAFTFNFGLTRSSFYFRTVADYTDYRIILIAAKMVEFSKLVDDLVFSGVSSS